ncbi:hypothetical protein CXU22_03260 [Akkermansia muciniphila]|uniref:Uncharacterized protein n=2 Tax=Akkermansia muciniphila TaxID=239935 RepID=A0A2N8HEX6_9BACT|nr:hypothetical protein CXU22_03260 [Akkermansia muciniphila]
MIMNNTTPNSGNDGRKVDMSIFSEIDNNTELSRETGELKQALHMLQEMKYYMKGVNLVLRRAGKNRARRVDALRMLGLNEEVIENLLVPNECGEMGFSPANLSLNESRINKLEAHLAGLEQQGKEEV